MRTVQFIKKVHLEPNKSVIKQKPYNYDLDRMKKAVESPGHRMTDNLDFEGFDKWMNLLAKKS